MQSYLENKFIKAILPLALKNLLKEKFFYWCIDTNNNYPKLSAKHNLPILALYSRYIHNRAKQAWCKINPVKTDSNIGNNNHRIFDKKQFLLRSVCHRSATNKTKIFIL
eukprot:TRINITY_DN6536_c0_g1_i5.p5 TRINITY_DN6536_c0_g1~~TRINITY_DN6536_c0_g1_i5.p5  ORF type:complete len:109 (+),score=2.08 TRINITY_DN6536_c0_g1_i5:221-547(+)